MKMIRFSKGFVPAGILSLVLILAGIAGYFLRGFNLGVDFQAGLIQEIQLAPPAFSLRYSGPANVSVSMDRNSFSVVVSGAGMESSTLVFPFAGYRDIGELCGAIAEKVPGVTFDLQARPGASPALLVQAARGNPLLGPEESYLIHYFPPDLSPVPIEDVRAALSGLGSVSVQILGQYQERRFMIRLDQGGNEEESEIAASAGRVLAALEAAFGPGAVAVTRSDYVDSRFSKHLAGQAGLLMALTLLLILVYASIRFKPQFAVGAVLAIAHDALIMVGFIAWTRMEFNTTTIAAILTILGYSINDTIVIFDRIRETRRIYPGDRFIDILDRSLSETLSRTIITTVTTMLAVLSLYIFTTRALFQADIPLLSRAAAVFAEHGNMKDFALALLVGMISGVYSTVFIASGLAAFWENARAKRQKRVPASAKAAPDTVTVQA